MTVTEDLIGQQFPCIYLSWSVCQYRLQRWLVTPAALFQTQRVCVCVSVCAGSGMNLLDISQKQWSAKALEVSCSYLYTQTHTSTIIARLHTHPPTHPPTQVCAAGFNLVAKLGDPVPSNSLLGPIAPHFVKRFGFSPSCQLVAFTGDNPCQLLCQ